MQNWHKLYKIIKLLIYGFYNEGIKVIVKSILESWISVCIILCLLIFLCSNQKTYFIAWVIIGIFALFAVIKAIYEIFMLIMKYIKTIEIEEKEQIIMSIGGKFFDIALSAIGVLQAGKILKHTVNITNAAKSALSLIDDIVAAISNFTKNFLK